MFQLTEDYVNISTYVMREVVNLQN